MKLLLDTVTFLNSALGPENLSSHATALIMDPESELFVSVVSSWEIVIKHALKKVLLADEPDLFLPEHRDRLGAELLGLDEASILHLTRLPKLHRDPFDRILVSQAIVHGMILLTPDRTLRKYPVRTAW